MCSLVVLLKERRSPSPISEPTVRERQRRAAGLAVPPLRETAETHEMEVRMEEGIEEASEEASEAGASCGERGEAAPPSKLGRPPWFSQEAERTSEPHASPLASAPPAGVAACTGDASPDAPEREEVRLEGAAVVAAEAPRTDLHDE